VNSMERGNWKYKIVDTSQQYSYCNTQFQTIKCADSRQLQHTKFHQFTDDRTAKCGKQYRLQLQSLYVMFCSRYSSGWAAQLLLSTVFVTSDGGPPALFDIKEYEILLCRGL